MKQSSEYRVGDRVMINDVDRERFGTIRAVHEHEEQHPGITFHIFTYDVEDDELGMRFGISAYDMDPED